MRSSIASISSLNMLIRERLASNISRTLFTSLCAARALSRSAAISYLSIFT